MLLCMSQNISTCLPLLETSSPLPFRTTPLLMSGGLSQSEQDDIDLAIALSLAQDAPPSPKRSSGSLSTPILLDSSSSDEGGPAPATAADDSETEVSDVEELAKRVAARKVAGQKRKATVALSKEGSTGSLKDGTTPASKKLKLEDSNTSSSHSLTGSEIEKQSTQPAFLTRAQMEKERLARQASRESASIDSHKIHAGFMASNGAKYAPRVATLSSISSETSQASSNGSTSTKATISTSSSSSGFGSLSTLRTDQAKRRYWQGKAGRHSGEMIQLIALPHFPRNMSSNVFAVPLWIRALQL
jgi:hypothetical protein